APDGLCIWAAYRPVEDRDGGVSHWFDGGDLAAAAARAEALAKSRNVYFGVALQDYSAALKEAECRDGEPRDPRYIRGFGDTAAALPGYFIDLDIAGPGHVEKALPRSLEEGREFLAV